MMGQVRSPLRGLLRDESYHVYAAYNMPLRDYRIQNGSAEAFVRRHMREHLAAFIANERVTSKEFDHTIEFRADLFVFSPDEFWGIVEATAMDLNRRSEMGKVRP